jgi:transcription elongation GreA/GreB family factor
MQSWSDTSRSQFRSVISNLQPQVSQLKQRIEELKELDIDKTYEQVQIGALVKLRLDGKEFLYFICSKGIGVETIENIMTLPIDSPLGQSLINKKPGETIRFNLDHKTKDILILEIS